MKISKLFFVVLLLVGGSVQGQEQDMPYLSVEDFSTISFQVASFPYTKFEVPPFILNGCYRGYLGVDGSDTEFIPLRQNLIDGTNAGSCGYGGITGDGTDDITVYKNNSTYEITSNSNSYSSVWKKNYSGAYAGHVIERTNDYLNTVFIHGEYKSDCESNIIKPVPSPCGQDQTYYWDAYYAFLSAEWLVSNSSNNWGYGTYNDIGPIAWPSTGFTKNGNKASEGFRHPSSIRYGDYIYIYVVESTITTYDITGSRKGVKLIRVHVDQVTDPNAYKIYHNGNWVKSLPSGFTKNNANTFFNIPGPQNSLIVGNWQTMRFSVAKINNSDYFIGVEEYATKMIEGVQHQRIALRLSTDLINWGERKIIYSIEGNWEASNIHYPIFMDKTGWHNDRVDADEFYILGSSNSNSYNWNKLTRIKLTLDCPENVNLTTREAIDNSFRYFTSSDNVSAQNNISGNSEVFYTANRIIRLRNGFKASKGVKMLAKVEDCGVLSNQKNIPNGRTIAQNEIMQNVENSTSKIEFKIYPNPANDKLHFKTANLSGESYCLSIRDIFGNILKEVCEDIGLNNGEEKIIDISNLKSGVFLFEYRCESLTERGRFIKN